MNSPNSHRRVQLRRAKGWRMPENTVKVARPTKWGNPYTIMEWGLPLALELYKRSVQGFWSATGIPDQKVARAYALHCAFQERMGGLEEIWTLRGKNLACFCRVDQWCHADILLELANDSR